MTTRTSITALELEQIFRGPCAGVRLNSGLWKIIFGSAEWQTSPSGHYPALYAPDFFLQTERPWWCPDQSLELTDLALSEILTQLVKKPYRVNWRGPDPGVFHRLFTRFQQDCRNPTIELKKVVPVVFSESPKTPDLQNWWSLLWQANQAPRHLTPYFLYQGNAQYAPENMVGVTPELLCAQTDTHTWQTMAVAGTRSLSSTSLLNSAKDLAEHNWVVRDLSEKLSPLGVVTVGATHEMNSGSIVHLRTNVQLRASQLVTFQDMITRLHPTAALGGYPAKHALTWLREMNPAPRGRLGAPFAWQWSADQGQCWVAIRCLQWNNQQALLGSGCGLVHNSMEQAEWSELAAKRHAVQQLLGML